MNKGFSFTLDNKKNIMIYTYCVLSKFIQTIEILKTKICCQLDISSVRVKSLHLSVDSKLNALSCSEVSSLSSEMVSEDGDWWEWRRDGGDSSNPRSMLGAKMRISGTLISLNLRLQISRNCHFVS